MAESRLESGNYITVVRSAARKFREHPKLDVLVNRIALFSGTNPPMASMVERIVSADPAFAETYHSLLDGLLPDAVRSYADKSNTLGDARTAELILMLSYDQVTKILCAYANMNPKPHFLQAVSTAAASRELAQHSRRFDPHEAFAAGLFHRLPVLMMAAVNGAGYKTIFESLAGSAGQLQDSERAAFGFCHLDITEPIAESWGLASYLQHAMQHYSEEGTGSKQPTVCVNMAFRFVHQLGFDGGLANIAPELPLSTLRVFGVGDQNIGTLVEKVTEDATIAEGIVSGQFKNAA